MARIQLGADYSSQGFLPGQSAHNALLAAQLFDRPERARLVPVRMGFEAVAADVDKDGDEDKTAVRLLPLTDAAGKSLANTIGATAEIDFEPIRWCKILNFVFPDDICENVQLSNFFIGQDNQFANKGVIPMHRFKADANSKDLDVPWCGPGVPLQLSFRNTTADARVVTGEARAIVIIG